MDQPKLILLFSGKRKSGKDFLTDVLYSRMNAGECALIKISGPIKRYWSTEKSLSYDELMSPGKMKENCRKQMIEWSDEIRNQDYGYFCREAIDMFEARHKPLWIVSDIRRKTDIKWFKENYNCPIKIVRIHASKEARSSRGWTFMAGVDDSISECDLDDFCHWDCVIENDKFGDADSLLGPILNEIKTTLL